MRASRAGHRYPGISFDLDLSPRHANLVGEHVDVAIRLDTVHDDKRVMRRIGSITLAMAPAFLLAQQCRYVDLDGPLLQTEDRAHALDYRGGEIQVPGAELWG